MSIVDWIEEYVPGGIDSQLGQLLDIAYNIEYGAESAEQSSLNLLYLLAYRGPGQMRIFGRSNEKYHVRGGNDQVPARLADALAGQVTLGSELVAIKRNADGDLHAGFLQGSGARTVTADRVVLAIPSRSSAAPSISRGPASGPLKRIAIAEQGMGTNSKLHVQFTRRHWEALGCNGETYSDRGYQSTWDVTRAQPGASGILVDYTGGASERASAPGTPTSAPSSSSLRSSRCCPGSGEGNGRATVDFWTANPWTPGSYSLLEGRPVHEIRRGRAPRRAPATSPASTPRLTSRATSTAPSRPGERAAGEVLDSLA